MNRRDAVWHTPSAMTTTLRDPNALISTADLAPRLAEPDLRIYDCTTYLEPPDPGSDDPYKTVSGRQTFLAAPCPGRRLPRRAGRA